MYQLHIYESLIHFSLLCYSFVDDSSHCLAHVINEVRVDGGNVTIEWEATGNGAGIVPTRCKLLGLTNAFPCKLLLTPCAHA